MAVTFTSMLLGSFLGSVVGFAGPAGAIEAPGGLTAVTCTNPYSGTTWEIRVDFTKATVNDNPARISDSEISWHDPHDGGNYSLDRKSGKLTVITASSTGGSTLFDRCKL